MAKYEKIGSPPYSFQPDSQTLLRSLERKINKIVQAIPNETLDNMTQSWDVLTKETAQLKNVC